MFAIHENESSPAVTSASCFVDPPWTIKACRPRINYRKSLSYTYGLYLQTWSRINQNPAAPNSDLEISVCLCARNSFNIYAWSSYHVWMLVLLKTLISCGTIIQSITQRSRSYIFQVSSSAYPKERCCRTAENFTPSDGFAPANQRIWPYHGPLGF
jgi:hypothetical protein